MAVLNEKRSLVAGTLAAIGASVCCVVPLVLLALGIGGAWIGNLTAFEPYRPLFIGLTLLFLVLVFRRLYLVPQVCAPGNGPMLRHSSGPRPMPAIRPPPTIDPQMKVTVLESVLTCPRCGFSTQETMPTDACTFFHECRKCKTLLRPKPGDCCVFCSYGSVKCPPIQEQHACCG